ncbi:hypothetical protein EYF80_022113 [Liparis tanakae]|uniref:Uncharacterized protein n=1 Tax=Liparis tanakae TaxID=230148 RepID=A0A4Z2HP79_9TELE|nr:hypothetical protein EYF80_022113 [Liparis tanakae]
MHGALLAARKSRSATLHPDRKRLGNSFPMISCSSLFTDDVRRANKPASPPRAHGRPLGSVCRSLFPDPTPTTPVPTVKTQMMADVNCSSPTCSETALRRRTLSTTRLTLPECCPELAFWFHS